MTHFRSIALSLAVLSPCAVACGESQNATTLKQTAWLSQCGGFAAKGGILLGEPAAYCDAEVLHWQYEESSRKLRLTNARVTLNCCGDHSITIEQRDAVYLVTERDAPRKDSGGARCLCDCVFDFLIEAEAIPPGAIELKILRNITDRGNLTKIVFADSVDLSLGSGTAVIDETDVGLACQSTPAP